MAIVILVTRNNAGVVTLVEEFASAGYKRVEMGDKSDGPFNVNNVDFGKRISAGPLSKSELADVDGDGDLDLTVGQGDGTLLYFENTAPAATAETPNPTPVFTPRTGTANPFDGIDVTPNPNTGSTSGRIVPRFFDGDGDEDLDLLMGTSGGQLHYYENTSSASATAPTFEARAGTANPFGNLVPIDTIDDSAPTFGDLDGDGDLDLVVGVRGGSLLYFENTKSDPPAGDGTAAPAFTERTGTDNPFDGIGGRNNVVPALADTDGDGDLDLVFGWHAGGGGGERPAHYENTGTRANPKFTEIATDDSRFSFGDTSVKGGGNQGPLLVDLDGDGVLELVLSTYNDAARYFKHDFDSTADPQSKREYDFDDNSDPNKQTGYTETETTVEEAGRITLANGDVFTGYWVDNPADRDTFSPTAPPGATVDDPRNTPASVTTTVVTNRTYTFNADGKQIGYAETEETTRKIKGFTLSGSVEPATPARDEDGTLRERTEELPTVERTVVFTFDDADPDRQTGYTETEGTDVYTVTFIFDEAGSRTGHTRVRTVTENDRETTETEFYNAAGELTGRTDVEIWDAGNDGIVNGTSTTTFAKKTAPVTANPVERVLDLRDANLVKTKLVDEGDLDGDGVVEWIATVTYDGEGDPTRQTNAEIFDGDGDGKAERTSTETLDLTNLRVSDFRVLSRVETFDTDDDGTPDGTRTWEFSGTSPYNVLNYKDNDGTADTNTVHFRYDSDNRWIGYGDDTNNDASINANLVNFVYDADNPSNLASNKLSYRETTSSADTITVAPHLPSLGYRVFEISQITYSVQQNIVEIPGRLTGYTVDTENDGTVDRTVVFTFDDAGGWTGYGDDTNGDGTADRNIVRFVFDQSDDEDLNYILRRELWWPDRPSAGERRIGYTEDADGDGTAESTVDFTFNGNRQVGYIRKRVEETNDAGVVQRTAGEVFNAADMMSARIVVDAIDVDGDTVVEETVTRRYAANDDNRATEIGRTETFDPDGDGTANSSRTYTFDANGKEIGYRGDADNDGVVDRIVTYVFDDAGKQIGYTEDRDGVGAVDRVVTHDFNSDGTRIDGYTVRLVGDYAAAGPDDDPFAAARVSSLSAPTLADVDGDGDLDLVVGIGGENAVNGIPTLSGELRYYENTGTATAPTFTEPTEASDNPFRGTAVSLDSAPALADLDGDGDLDLTLGARDGTLKYFENTGTATAPTFTEPTEASDNPFDGIDVGDFSAPALTDGDGDGDFDLVVGDGAGALSYYENTGTASAPVFRKLSGRLNPFDDVDVAGRSKPFFADLNGDGRDALVLGRRDGTLQYYENTGTRTVADPADSTKRITIPTFVERGRTDNPFAGIDVGRENAPTLGDVDGDGVVDLLVGREDGTLRYVTVPAETEPAPAVAYDFDDANDPDKRTGYTVDPDGDAGPAAPERVVTYDFDADGDRTGSVVRDNTNIENGERTVRTVERTFEGRRNFNDADDFDDFDRQVEGVTRDYVDADQIADRIRTDVFNAEGRQIGYTDRYEENPANAYEERTGSANPFFAGNPVTDADGDPVVNGRPVLADLDNDGDLDLVLGGGDGSLRYYEDTGEAFVERTGDANPFAAISPAQSLPLLVDHDGDGKLDLVVRQAADSAVLGYYRNTGTRTEPAFTLQTEIPFPVEGGGGRVGVSLDQAGALALGDVDGDGDLDLVAGGYDGTLRYYERREASFVGRINNFNPFVGVDVAVNSVPALVDYDDDGDLDLVVGIGGDGVTAGQEDSGKLHYWENTGRKTTVTQVDDFFGTSEQAQVQVFRELTGTDNPFDHIDVGTNSVPVFVDYDGTAAIDLVVGAGDGSLKYHQGQSEPGEAYAFTFGGTDQTGSRTGYTVDLHEDGDVDRTVIFTATGYTVDTNRDGRADYTLRRVAGGYEDDQNGDGIPDYVWTYVDQTDSLYRGDFPTSVFERDGTFPGNGRNGNPDPGKVDETGDVDGQGADINAQYTYTAGGFRSGKRIDVDRDGDWDIFQGNSLNKGLTGTDESDRLLGRAGPDRLEGGGDADVFIFNLGDGEDTIVDFEDGSDMILFRGIINENAIAERRVGEFDDLTIEASGSDAVVRYGDGGDSITLTGVSVSDLTAMDFDFVA